MNNLWEIRASAETERKADIYVYGDIESDGYNFWTGEAIRAENSANAFRDKLAEMGDLDEIDIYINSTGGSVFEGVAIYNQLRRVSAKKVVHIDGFACSIASVIAMAGDEIVMPRNALMMIHNAWTYACGNADELRKSADDLEIVSAAMSTAYLDKSGGKLDKDKLAEMLRNETWLSAEDCLAYGLCDRIDERDADMADAAAKMDKVTANLKGRVEIAKSIAAQLRGLETPPPRSKKPEETPRGLCAMLAGIKN